MEAGWGRVESMQERRKERKKQRAKHTEKEGRRIREERGLWSLVYHSLLEYWRCAVLYSNTKVVKMHHILYILVL